MPLGRNISKKEIAGKEDGKDSSSFQKHQLPHWIKAPPRYKMSDLILRQQTYQQLQEVIAYYKNRDFLFGTWGLADKYEKRKGLSVNLYGDSGTGKTMAAHAVAYEVGLPIICVDYAEIESKYVGETSKNLTSLFRYAAEENAVIFFDEADALLSKRVSQMTSATDVSVNQTRSVLLTLLNEYQGIILFATNFIQNFDSAFLRRIHYHIRFLLPDQNLREKLWKMYIPARMPCEADYRQLAAKFDEISGSDIANAVFSAAVSSVANHEEVVRQCRFEEAIQRSIEAKIQNSGDTYEISDRIVTEEEAKKLF